MITYLVSSEKKSAELSGVSVDKISEGLTIPTRLQSLYLSLSHFVNQIRKAEAMKLKCSRDLNRERKYVTGKHQDGQAVHKTLYK